MRDTVSHLAADPRGAARDGEPGADSTSAAASARAFEQGNDLLADLVRQVSAAGQAASARARSADVANDSGAEPQDGNAPGTVAVPQNPFVQRSRAADATRPLAATGVWNASADNTTTEECVPGTLPAQRWLLDRWVIGHTGCRSGRRASKASWCCRAAASTLTVEQACGRRSAVAAPAAVQQPRRRTHCFGRAAPSEPGAQ